MSEIRVLIVDDDPTLLRSLDRTLTDEGFDVVTSYCVAEARIVMKGQDFDAVVCDYNMPGQSGLEFLEELSKQDSKIPAFLLSGCIAGLAMAEDWAREVGVREVFAKPCDASIIADAIRTACGELLGN